MRLFRSHYFLTFLLGAVLLVLPNPALAAACDGVGGTINCAAQEVVYSIVMGILGMFVALAAGLLSFAVNSFVLGFGDAFVNTGIGVAVDNTWIIVRDFVNLGFIFGFVYIGFKMILNSSDSNTRRWLVNIILAALLVNFSLFAVKFAIDVSNQLASQIAINGLGSTCTDADCVTKDGLRQIDLATEFMARMGINNSFGLTIGQVDGKGWGYIFGTALLMLTAMFVFAAGGLMLIMRFAVLNLFMVLSPIMFLSWIIPAIKDTFERFWSMFIGRALVAPIYLLFIYFSLQIISGLQVSVGGNGNGFANPDWAGTFQGAQTVAGGKAAGQLGTFPFFILVCIFLGLSVWAADKLGADGGSKAMSLGRSFERKVRGYAGRAASKPLRMGVGGATRLAGAGAANIENRLNRRLGTMAQGGWVSRGAARVLDRTAGAGLRNTQNASVAGSESYNARNTRVGQQQARFNQQAQEDARQARFAQEQTNYNNANPADAAGRVARRNANNAIGGQVRRMSDAEIMAMVQANPALLNDPSFAQHLTDGHMTALRNSGMMTNQEHDNLGNLRNEAAITETTTAFEDVNATTDELNDSFTQLGQTIRNMSADRKAGLGANRLATTEVAMHLTDRDIDQLEQSGRFNANEITNIRTARTAAQTQMANGNITLTGPGGNPRAFAGHGTANGDAFFNQQRQNMMRDAHQAGNLPAALFSNANMVEHVTPQALEQRIRNGLSGPEAGAIRRNLEIYISGLPAGDPAKRVWEDWDNRSVNAGQIDLDPNIF